MKRHIPRQAQALLEALLARNPAVSLIGGRQTGKSSLARKVAANRPSVIFDLEKRADRDALDDHGIILRKHADKLVVIDEVQNKPELFSELRVLIDELRADGRPYGKFLLLGSVTGRLQKQSEGLTGRIAQMRMHPLNWLEVASTTNQGTLVQRGGLPGSLFAASNADSLDWRRNYLEMTVQKDALTANGSRLSFDYYDQLLTLLAARQKDILNKAQLASELKIGAETVTRMLANLEDMMIIRKLPSYAMQVPRRVARNPKYYICDSGLFCAAAHCDLSALGDTPAAGRLRGAAWEGFVIDNLLSVLPRHWKPYFFRAHKSGNEIDLLLAQPGGSLWAIEIKAAANPTPDRNFVKCLALLQPARSFLVHGGDFKHRGRGSIEIVSLADMMNELRAQETLVQPQPTRRIVAADSGFAELIESLTANSPLANLHRRRFGEHFGQQFELLVTGAPAADDRQAGSQWQEARNQLLEWLDLESALRPRGEEAADWRACLAAIFEAMLAAADHDDGGKAFARLCCHDLFVHAIALLVRNRSFASVHALLARKYCWRGRMHNYTCLGSPAPAAESQPPQVADFITGQPAEKIDLLISAELLILLHSMLTDGAESGWQPWLGRANPGTSELPFFMQAASEEGLGEVLACLGLPVAPASIQTISAQVARLKTEPKMPAGADANRIERCLQLAQWYDMGASQ